MWKNKQNIKCGNHLKKLVFVFFAHRNFILFLLFYFLLSVLLDYGILYVCLYHMIFFVNSNIPSSTLVIPLWFPIFLLWFPMIPFWFPIISLWFPMIHFWFSFDWHFLVISHVNYDIKLTYEPFTYIETIVLDNKDACKYRYSL